MENEKTIVWIVYSMGIFFFVFGFINNDQFEITVGLIFIALGYAKDSVIKLTKRIEKLEKKR